MFVSWTSLVSDTQAVDALRNPAGVHGGEERVNLTILPLVGHHPLPDVIVVYIVYYKLTFNQS